MRRALAIKELRDTAGIVLGAVFFHAMFVVSAMGLPVWPWWWRHDFLIPFVNDQFLAYYVVVSGCLAAALGLRQSAFETVFGTEQFLLHRPLTREWLIGTKLLVGGCLYLIVAAVPILVYAWWAATPGTHASPFEWSMTATAWKVWLTTTVLYLGGFLSGIRPGRWQGTRLLPLVAAIGLVYVLVAIPWLWGWCLLAVVLIDGLLVTTIFHVARTRDF